MPTTNRLDKDTTRLDAGFMSNYCEEVDVERRLMLFCQHSRNCNEKYQGAVAIRRLVEDQKTKTLLDKYKETPKRESVSLTQEKTSKPKVAIKSEQQSISDPSRSHKDIVADSNKESSSSSSFIAKHNREAVIEIDPGGARSSSSSGIRSSSHSIVSGTVVKQEEGAVSSSSSCPHRTTDIISKSLSLDTSSTQQQQQQQPNMGLCDSNNSSSYTEAKTTSVSSSSRKSSIGNITANGFIGLPGKPDDELNLNAESFISENATINFLPSVDADNPDPLPVKKPVEPNKQLLPQRAPLPSSRSDDTSAHESDVEKGMDEFSKVMDQVIKREEGVSQQMRCNSSSTSLCQLPDLPQLPTTTSSTGNHSGNSSTSSPPPYPGTPSSGSIQQAAQQLASVRSKFQHMVASMEHPASISQPPTPMGTVDPSWQQQQQQQQQQMMAAKQQQQQQHMMMQQQHYHLHPAKPTPMQRKPQQQQYDFLKSASPNVTIVRSDPYCSAMMNMPQQQQQQSQHVMVPPNMSQHHQQMMHAPVQTIAQVPQQSPATISMPRNQPQLYPPLPSASPYMGPTVDQHVAMTTRSSSIPYGGQIDGHLYQQHQQRRHSMPPQLPTQQQSQWQQAAQHQDMMFDFCSPAMNPHSMAGQKRCQSYFPSQVSVAKRSNAAPHSAILSHAMSPAAVYQQHGTLVNGELTQAFHNPINEPLLHFDNRNDLFSAPM